MCVFFFSVALTDFNRVLVLPARDSCVLYQLKFAFEKPLRLNVYVYMYNDNDDGDDRHKRLSQIQIQLQL